MIRHLISKIDKDDSIWGGRPNKQLFVVSDISWTKLAYALGNHMGPDIFHFLKVVINVLCLSSVALLCVFRKVCAPGVSCGNADVYR